jgi:imidazoleglycerol-phosphate dehydratase
VARKTKETDIRLTLGVDGSGRYAVATGVPFLDHMLELLARHGFFDLTVQATGDLHVDHHHTVEDVGLVLGQALREALGEKTGIRRFGEATVPLDEALVQTVVDLGQPFFVTT